MIGYTSKWDKALRIAKKEFGFLNDEAAIRRVAKQYMAKFIVGLDVTIGKDMNTNRFYFPNRKKLFKPILP